MPQPSYYAVIPASVRYCEGLPPAAKLLYGEITALCSVQGYCWAGTDYFAALYGVDRSTVKKWLAALAQHGFICVEVNREWAEQRRIYLADAVPKKPGGVAQKRATGGAKTSHRWRKNEPQSITENITKSKTLNVGAVATSLPTVDETGAATPRVVDSLAVQCVSEVVALTNDAKSERRFRQLYDIADAANVLPEWDTALVALKMALKRARKPVEAPGAYFASILSRALNVRGVYVPVGTPDDRADVRALIAQSMEVVK